MLVKRSSQVVNYLLFASRALDGKKINLFIALTESITCKSENLYWMKNRPSGILPKVQFKKVYKRFKTLLQVIDSSCVC